MLRKKKFSLNKRSEHIVSCDFQKIPDYIYNNAGIKREEIIQFPLVRMEGQNKLLINENDPDWKLSQCIYLLWIHFLIRFLWICMDFMIKSAKELHFKL